MEKIWFKRKRYGWGWTPSTWEGWLVIALYVASMVLIGNASKDYASTRDILLGFVVPAFLITTLLILVSWGKGEKPRWQWGKEKK